MPTQARDRLLARTMQHVSEHGVEALSLRELAAAVGSSHRMLLYHFGSKEGLLVAVVREMEIQQRDRMAHLRAGGDLSPADWVRRLWRAGTASELAGYERLFVQLYGQALQGRPHTSAFLDGIVDSWVRPVAARFVAAGASASSARTDARVVVAAVRGLLLDLLATGDRVGTERCLERFLTAYEGPTDLGDGRPHAAQARSTAAAGASTAQVTPRPRSQSRRSAAS